MIWIQPPGTPTMGHLFLDAYHATGDEYYYRAAEQVAGALMLAQHPSGGWNYVVDFAGERSLRDWYDTVGPQRVAPRGVPARLGQRHLRRWRDVAVREVPAAAVPREARPDGTRPALDRRHPVRPRQPVPDRRVAAALPAEERVLAPRQARLHVVPHVQRRRDGGERRLPGACATRPWATRACSTRSRAA